MTEAAEASKFLDDVDCGLQYDIMGPKPRGLTEDPLSLSVARKTAVSAYK